MVQSSSTSDMSSVEVLTQRTRAASDIVIEAATNEGKASAITPPAKRDPGLKVFMASCWNEALCCEARNSLQVILSGAELMLEDHLGNLLVGQKELLSKMTDNAYQLGNLLTELLGPEELRLEEKNEGRFGAIHHVPADV